MSDQFKILRKQIDAIDGQILTALAKRMQIARQIGKLKKEQGIAAFDKERWQDLLKSNIKKGGALGLSKKFIKNLINLIHKYSLEIQQHEQH